MLNSKMIKRLKSTHLFNSDLVTVLRRGNLAKKPDGHIEIYYHAQCEKALPGGKLILEKS